MTSSKCASLCDTEASCFSVRAAQAASHQTVGKGVFDLAFLSALCIVWVAQLQPVFPGQQ